VSRRRNVERRRQSLAEIREIMNSMKTLAYMETRKLSRFLDAQTAVERSIKEVAADFLSFHGDVLPQAQTGTPLYLVIGSERGFCGDFNHALLEKQQSALRERSSGSPALIAVGHKLHTLLEGDARVVAWIDGASVVEEVAGVLNQLANEIVSFQTRHGAGEVFCVYHGSEDGVVVKPLLPPFAEFPGTPQHHSVPPLLHLPPAAFLIELTDQYLFAALHAILYTSLMLENRHRVTHLEGAVKHLDDQSAELARQSNALRQEEIIEEIEVILLSAASTDGDPRQRDDAGPTY